MRSASALRREWPVAAFFLVAFLAGVLTFPRFGVGWDEPNARENGLKSLQYALSGGGIALDHIERYHGPAFELVLAVFEKVLGLRDTREIYLMRHLAGYLFFLAGTAAFYRLARDRFESRLIALLGAAMLLLSPRIFADAFGNSKDIPCLVMFVVCFLTMRRFLDGPSPARALLHGLASAFLIDIRVAGVLVPAFTLIFFALDHAASRRRPSPRAWKALGIYVLALALLVVFFWPLLWEDPLARFAEAFRQSVTNPWPSSVLYLGRYIKGAGLPWHYLPVWILVTTPLAYSLLALAGTVSLLLSCRRGLAVFYRENREDLGFACWLFVPLLGVFLLRPTLYDGWRHFFFVYPALVLLALRGWLALGAARPAGLLALLLLMAHTAWRMAVLHPYQNLYFNRLAGPSLKVIKGRFDLDYWGLSYREGFERILMADPRSKINVALAAYPLGLAALNILPEPERRRLAFPTADGARPDYFMSNYRWHKDEYALGEPYCTLVIGGARILVIYRGRRP